MAKKKRYYQSSNNKREMYSEAYAGYDPRRRQELEDSMMLHEDRSAVANLPQDVKYHPWPNTGYARYDLDDTLRGVDHQMDEDMKYKKKGSNEAPY
jgi:hypothetical protein